jgi:tetratricopeptide (TPR) repeat protein
LGDYEQSSKIVDDLSRLPLDSTEEEWLLYLKRWETYIALLQGKSHFHRVDNPSLSCPKTRFMNGFLQVNLASMIDPVSVPKTIESILSRSHPNAFGISQRTIEVRLLKLKIMHSYWVKDNKTYESHFDALNQHFLNHNKQDFLEVESLRRVGFFFATRACSFGIVEKAFAIASLLTKIDPFCSAVHTLKGMIEEQLGHNRLAEISYEKAYSLGFIEKDFCRSRLVAMSCNNRQNRPDMTASIQRLWSAERSLNRSDSKPDLQSLNRLLERSHTFQRYPAIHKLTPDENDQTPFWYQQIKKAHENLAHRSDLFFSTAYFQSLQPQGFRASMYRSAFYELGIQNSLSSHLEPFLSLDSSIYRSNNHILDLREQSLNHSENACYVSRLFMYLGLEKDAQDTSKWVWDKRNWDAHDSYLAYTNLLLSYRADGDAHYFQKCLEAFQRFPEAPETLRVRLMLAIQCGGLFGKKGDVDKVLIWREKGESILEKILNSSSFPEIEKLLLHSRWYRFASFLPFLNGDSQKLNQETEIYLELSKEALKAQSTPFTRENMYAALETKARIAESQGNLEEAYRSFLELRDSIDPFDSKVEINLGDIAEKQGDVEKAYEHYSHAQKKAPPIEEMALLKLARINFMRRRYSRALFEMTRYQELLEDSHLPSQIVPDILSKCSIH